MVPKNTTYPSRVLFVRTDRVVGSETILIFMGAAGTALLSTQVRPAQHFVVVPSMSLLLQVEESLESPKLVIPMWRLHGAIGSQIRSR
jgi:hypothetical protein